MSNRTLSIDDRLYEYLLTTSVREPELLKRLREETARDSMSQMQIAPEQGQFMRLLVQITETRRAIEIGTYTGYSSLCVALALPDDGELVCCDTSEEWTTIARRYWREAGVEHKINLQLGPALETLDQLIDQDGVGTFDFVFIDADKENYHNYYRRCYELLRVGGVMTVDNTLWNGRVADTKNQDETTKAIRAFNEFVYNDQRVNLSLVPIGDGLTIVRKN